MSEKTKLRTEIFKIQFAADCGRQMGDADTMRELFVLIRDMARDVLDNTRHRDNDQQFAHDVAELRILAGKLDRSAALIKYRTNNHREET